MSSALAVALRLHQGSDATIASPIATVNGLDFTASYLNGQQKTCTVDHVFQHTAKNRQVFEEFVAPMVDTVFQGNNGTIISYGDDGAGQSHTWIGDDNDGDGLLDMIADRVFLRVKEVNATDECMVIASMYQIVDEFIIDLFNPAPKRTLTLAEHRLYNTYVDGAAELDVYTAVELKQLISEGLLVYRALQQRSQFQHIQPHLFVNIRIESRSKTNAQTITASTFRFANLSVARGQPYDEKSIDHGNMIFSNIFKGAAEGVRAADIQWEKSHVTQLLKPSLIGQTFTHMLIFADCRQHRQHETINTHVLTTRILELKRRVRIVAKPMSLTLVIRLIRSDIETLRTKLALTAGTAIEEVDEDTIEYMKQMVKELDAVKARTWNKIKQQSLRYRKERVENMKVEGFSPILTGLAYEEVPEDLKAQARMKLDQLVDLVNRLDKAEQEIKGQKTKYEKLVIGKLEKGASIESVEEEPKMQELAKSISDSIANAQSLATQLTQGKGEYKELGDQMTSIERAKEKVHMVQETIHKQGEMRQLQEFSDMRSRLYTDMKLEDEIKIEDSLFEEKTAAINEKFGKLNKDTLMVHKEEFVEHAVTSNRAAKEIKRLQWQRNQLQALILEHDYTHEAQTEEYKKQTLYIFEVYRHAFEERKRQLDSHYKDSLQKSLEDALRLKDENEVLRSTIIARRQKR